MLLQSPNVNIFLAGEGQIYRQERKPYQIEEINEDLNELGIVVTLYYPLSPHTNTFTHAKKENAAQKRTEINNFET